MKPIPVPEKGRAKPRSRFWRENGWLLLPALGLYLLFVIGPVLLAGAISVYHWDGISAPRFAGLSNYSRALFGDPIFLRSFVNNGIYIGGTLVVEVGFGLLFAAALQARLPYATFWRALFFSPMVLSMVVVGLLWGFVFNPDAGLLNGSLRSLGLERWERAWLGEEATALLCIALVSGWRYAGFYMALFAAGLRRIPSSVLEAGRLDGAGEWTLFRRVTLPLLAPITAIAILLCVTGGFQAFDLFFVMTDGGPYHSTEIPSLWMIKKAFDRQSLGYGASLGVLLAVVVGLVGAAQLYLRRRQED
jgi:raffinose/stachyose/melibiose transport system permease protein